MLIGLVIAVIIIYLIISSYLKNYRDADEKTLRPFHEWIILSSSRNKRSRERMAYSLLIQAELILEKEKRLQHKTLRNLMISNPQLCKTNFILFIVESTIKFDIPLNEVMFLKESYERDQARIYLAKCISLILHYGGAFALKDLAVKACSLPDN